MLFAVLLLPYIIALMKKYRSKQIVTLIILVLLFFASRFDWDSLDRGAGHDAGAVSQEADASHTGGDADSGPGGELSAEIFSFSEIPPYSGSPVYIVNDDVPFFTENDIKDEPYESFSELDKLGRCGPAMGMLHRDMMPDWERENISSVKPTAWHRDTYDFIDGELLYNRSHLIAFMFTGQGANPLNLITGTRYMNATGMLPYEEEVADYLRYSDDYVLYRVTPYFEGDDLLASGVLMEAKSVSDDGDSLQFCIYCYNVQPGIGIDYSDGDNWLLDDEDLDSREF